MVCFLHVEVPMIDLREVRSVTEFQRNAREYVGKLKDSKTPLVLTVNGRAELVVQDAGSYQDMLDRLEELETVAAIRMGLQDLESGKVRPARKALKNLGEKLGMQR
jgi:PHD/YefM family antitoxin component YafN of YafNO toxin-antitoxin module